MVKVRPVLGAEIDAASIRRDVGWSLENLLENI